jgi:hypothetical protein
MHRKKMMPLAAIALLGFVGSAAAQDSAQTTPETASANAGGANEMTCADLNEMDAPLAIAFFQGYQYGATAPDRAAALIASKASNARTTASTPAPTAGVGNATTTGDVTGSGTAAGGAVEQLMTAEGTPFDAEAILNSCFDLPSKPIDELLSGAFGKVE